MGSLGEGTQRDGLGFAGRRILECWASLNLLEKWNFLLWPYLYNFLKLLLDFMARGQN